MRGSKWKRLMILVWACALAFGLTYHVGEADALHSSCNSQCIAACVDNDGCAGATGYGCFCIWTCGDGTESDSICV